MTSRIFVLIFLHFSCVLGLVSQSLTACSYGPCITCILRCTLCSVTFFYRNDCVCKVLSNLVHNRYLYMQVFYNVIFSQWLFIASISRTWLYGNAVAWLRKFLYFFTQRTLFLRFNAESVSHSLLIFADRVLRVCVNSSFQTVASISRCALLSVTFLSQWLIIVINLILVYSLPGSFPTA